MSIFKRAPKEPLSLDWMALRQSMVENQLKRRNITRENVLKAFLKIAREEFVPNELKKFSYEDRPLHIGEEQTITFVADKTGGFEFYCSVGNHRAMGMVGTLIVR